MIIRQEKSNDYGIIYSVIKNALYKVIKLRSKEELGNSILVQGGTFYNEAVLRAFEKEAGVNAIRPDIAGLMGAFGIARLAHEQYNGQPSTLLTRQQLDEFTCESEIRYCQKCTNHCMLTVSTFNDNSEYISGNRCERGANLPLKSKTLFFKKIFIILFTNFPRWIKYLIGRRNNSFIL